MAGRAANDRDQPVAISTVSDRNLAFWRVSRDWGVETGTI
jgi:hypothetical protein